MRCSDASPRTPRCLRIVNLADFPLVNEVMAGYFDEPYPARAAIGVASLPKGARVEMEGVLVTAG